MDIPFPQVTEQPLHSDQSDVSQPAGTREEESAEKMNKFQLSSNNLLNASRQKIMKVYVCEQKNKQSYLKFMKL
jgi:hypothetical protein